MLVKLKANNKTIILGTHTNIVWIRMQNCIDNNQGNVGKYGLEEILDFIVKELLFLGWKIVYDYDKARDSNCKVHVDLELIIDNNKLTFQ